VGYTKPSGSEQGLDVDVTYVPVELNAKYAVQVSPWFVIDLGAGPSYNYGKVRIQDPIRDSKSKWRFGGQAFAGLNIVFDHFYFGANGKYQITEKKDGVAFDNWRIGGHLGLKF
jgi:opacity protein-like surface antigen